MAARVKASKLPEGALLARYCDMGAYTDCYEVHVPFIASHDAYVEAFYTSWLFKLERLVLGLASLPSSDAHVTELATGERDTFAAWRVEARTPEQLLLCDVNGRTRSWLMTGASETGAAGRTLYFGSAIVPAAGAAPGAPALDFPYRQSLGLHRVYSRALLSAAAARLMRQRGRLQ